MEAVADGEVEAEFAAAVFLLEAEVGAAAEARGVRRHVALAGVEAHPRRDPGLAVGERALHAEALARLEAAKGPNESYLPHAIGDGGEAYLNLCAYSGWSSLLTPRQDALEISWLTPEEAASDEVTADLEGGRGALLQQLLHHAGAL